MADARPARVEAFARFCACLNQYDVDYLVVGSEAVAFHGAPRYSADFDTCVAATAANLLRVAAALKAFGAQDIAQSINPETWARTGATLRLGETPNQIDVLLQLSGVTYGTIRARGAAGRIGDVPVRFIGLDDLLVNKRAAGREKDLADVRALEEGRKDTL